MAEYTTIKVLKEKGESIKAIARQLKISKNTVKKYLKESDVPKYQVQEEGKKNDELNIISVTKSKWESYKEEIVDMHYNKKFIVTRIYDELKDRGACGSMSGLYQYIRGIKKNDVSGKIRARFETGPGKQTQFDWSDYTLRIGKEYRKVYIFCLILCYSRYKYYIASYSKNQAAIFEAIESGYEEFGGVTEEILSDNARQMVTNANPKSFQWNQQYVQFLQYYNINPKVCKVRHSWTKGKVENPFYYLEEHFIKGREFESLDDVNKKLKEFTNQWNMKHNSGINDIPEQRYNVELQYLQALPKARYVGNKLVWCDVSNDCLISYGSNKYSVPHVYAFNNVWIKEKLGDELNIYSQKGRLIASHKIPKDKGNVITKEEHYKGLIYTTTNNAYLMKKEFNKHFPEQCDYLNLISSQKRFNWKKHIGKIIELTHIYKKEDVLAALISSMRHNVFSYDFVLAYMREHYDIEYRGCVNTVSHKDYGVMSDNEQKINRDLTDYEEASNG